MTGPRDTLGKAWDLAIIFVVGTAASYAYVIFWIYGVVWNAKTPNDGLSFLKTLQWYAYQIPIAPMVVIDWLMPQLYSDLSFLLITPFWMAIGFGVHRLWRKHHTPPTPWV